MSGTGNLQVTSRSDMLSSFLVYIYIYICGLVIIIIHN